MAAVSLRQSEGAEIEARDDSERTQRTDEQFVQVVAGDILHDAAAAFAERALAVNKLRANQEIARSAVLLAQGGIDAGGERTGHR